MAAPAATVVVPNPPDDASFSPNDFFIFLVGNCEEWPENRKEQGDIALYHAYLNAGVPDDHIFYLKDDECTQSNCQSSLETFLTTTATRPDSNIVFYYGGHGEAFGFNTVGEDWEYEQVVRTIETHFVGDRILFLVDCCASGNLHQCLSSYINNTNSNKKKKKACVCLTNTPPYIAASDEGEEWVVTHSWIRAMQCQPIPPLSTVMEFYADRLALVLGNQAVFTCSPGVDLDSRDWMPSPLTSSSLQQQNPRCTLEWPRLEQNIPKDARVTAKHWFEGDAVFYKHKGGPVDTKNGSSLVVPPGWLNATIILSNVDGHEEDPETVSLQVVYQNQQWVVQNTPRDQLMNDLYMGNVWMLPDGIKHAQLRLARNFKYIDYSWQSYSAVRAINKKGQVQEATIVDWRDVDWEDSLDSKDNICCKKPPFGAHVPIRWNSEGGKADSSSSTVVILPVQYIQSPHGDATIPQETFLTVLPSNKKEAQQCARKALTKSIESSGKQICHASSRVGKDNADNLTVYWPHDGEWYDAEAMNPDTLPLKILASHVQFTLSGKYCPVAYEDGEFALTPLHYVRRRGRSESSCCSCCVK